MSNSPWGFVGTMLDTGFDSPADYQPILDLNHYVSDHPSSTFYMRVSGNAHQTLNIFDGDILVIDRSLLPQKSKIIVISTTTELQLSKFTKPENFNQQNQYWGTVTHLIRKLK